MIFSQKNTTKARGRGIAILLLSAAASLLSAAPALSAEVVSRVRTINFGAKEGVAALTIVYPIDFLPAA